MSVLPNLKKDTKEKDAKEKRHERNTKTKKEGKGSGSSASSTSTKELWGRHAKWRPKNVHPIKKGFFAVSAFISFFTKGFWDLVVKTTQLEYLMKAESKNFL